MKWYSVKEHQPILSICCVLLAVHIRDTGSIYLILGEWDNGWKEWDDKYDIEKELPGHEVLYFCYPDPIPKAYESLIESNKLINFPNKYEEILIHNLKHNDQSFNMRTIRCLASEGINTLGQLLCWCDHQLFKTPNLGNKSVTEIKVLLAHKDLYLGMSPSYKTNNDYDYSKCFACRNKELNRDASR